MIHKVAIISVLLLSGCANHNSTASKKVEEFSKKIESAGKLLDVSEAATINIPKLDHDELLVVINAGYAGYFKAGDSAVSRKLEAEINKYGSQEAALTYILLIKGESIIVEKSISSVNFITDNKPSLENNAKVAVYADNKANIGCIHRMKSVSDDDTTLWNPRCIVQLIDFE